MPSRAGEGCVDWGLLSAPGRRESKGVERAGVVTVDS